MKLNAETVLFNRRRLYMIEDNDEASETNFVSDIIKAAARQAVNVLEVTEDDNQKIVNVMSTINNKNEIKKTIKLLQYVSHHLKKPPEGTEKKSYNESRKIIKTTIVLLKKIIKEFKRVDANVVILCKRSSRLTSCTIGELFKNEIKILKAKSKAAQKEKESLEGYRKEKHFKHKITTHEHGIKELKEGVEVFKTKKNQLQKQSNDLQTNFGEENKDEPLFINKVEEAGKFIQKILRGKIVFGKKDAAEKLKDVNPYVSGDIMSDLYVYSIKRANKALFDATDYQVNPDYTDSNNHSLLFLAANTYINLENIKNASKKNAQEILKTVLSKCDKNPDIAAFELLIRQKKNSQINDMSKEILYYNKNNFTKIMEDFFKSLLFCILDFSEGDSTYNLLEPILSHLLKKGNNIRFKNLLKKKVALKNSFKLKRIDNLKYKETLLDVAIQNNHSEKVIKFLKENVANIDVNREAFFKCVNQFNRKSNDKSFSDLLSKVENLWCFNSKGQTILEICKNENSKKKLFIDGLLDCFIELAACKNPRQLSEYQLYYLHMEFLGHLLLEDAEKAIKVLDLLTKHYMEYFKKDISVFFDKIARLEKTDSKIINKFISIYNENNIILPMHEEFKRSTLNFLIRHENFQSVWDILQMKGVFGGMSKTCFHQMLCEMPAMMKEQYDRKAKAHFFEKLSKLPEDAKTADGLMLYSLLSDGHDDRSFSSSYDIACGISYAIRVNNKNRFKEFLRKIDRQGKYENIPVNLDEIINLEDGGTITCLIRAIGLYHWLYHSSFCFINGLLINGARADACDGSETSALLCAIQLNKESIVEVLLKSLKDDDLKKCLNKENEDGDFPLLAAVKNNNIEICTSLLKPGADPNFQVDNGKTPLFLATQNKNKAICDLLVKDGADSTIPTSNEQNQPFSPRDLAVELANESEGKDYYISQFFRSNNACQHKYIKKQLEEFINNWQMGLAKQQSLEESSQAIQKYASNKGLTCFDVSGDGNCFFHAVSDQLESLGLANITFEDLRARALDYMIKNINKFREFITQEENQYFDENSTSGAWADHPIIVALAEALNITIVIIRSDEDTHKINEEPNQNVINLGYEVGVHYYSLREVNLISFSEGEGSVPDSSSLSMQFSNS